MNEFRQNLRRYRKANIFWRSESITVRATSWSLLQATSTGTRKLVSRPCFTSVPPASRHTILDELHAARRRILTDYNGDTAAYLHDAKARLEASGRPIESRRQRTIQCTGVAKSSESAVESP